MKRFAATILVLALAPGLSHAGDVGSSELSAGGAYSIVLGSALIIASPFVLVGDIVDASTKGNRVAVRVKTDQGRQETLELPKEATAKANLQPGDKLTVTPAKSGAILAKNDMPIAFVVTQENAKLSHSHELAK